MVVTIVFLVLLVIGLGITAYYGFAYQADKDKAAATAKQDLATMKNLRDWEKFKALLLKAYMGYASPAELTDLATMRDQYKANSLKAGDDKQAVDEMIQKLDTAFPWDDTQKKPAANFADTLAAMNQKVKTVEAGQARVDSDAKAKLSDLDGLLKTNSAELDALRAKLKEANTAAAELHDLKSKSFDDANNQISQLRLENGKIKEDDIKKIQDLEKRVAELTKEDTALKRSIQDLKPHALSKIDLLTYEKPRGKIVSISRSGSFAYVDLGSADHVNPQLTFSVFGVGPDGKPIGFSVTGDNDQVTSQPKADLEILNVVEAHLSTAKITHVYDAGANPVGVGDVIFNPAWNPTVRQHVAIAGLIDLTGDGRDSTLEFVRNLEKQNIIVDSYLDLRDMTVKGKGIGLQTNYLVLGELPEFEAGVQNPGGNPVGGAQEEHYREDDRYANRCTEVWGHGDPGPAFHGLDWLPGAAQLFTPGLFRPSSDRRGSQGKRAAQGSGPGGA